MSKMGELTSKIEKWASERGLDHGDPAKQVLKLGEEFGEICEGFAKNDFMKVVDGIGDNFVVLTVLSKQIGMSIEDCVSLAYNQIKNRKGKMVNGVFIKEEDLSGK